MFAAGPLRGQQISVGELAMQELSPLALRAHASTRTAVGVRPSGIETVHTVQRWGAETFNRVPHATVCSYLEFPASAALYKCHTYPILLWAKGGFGRKHNFIINETNYIREFKKNLHKYTSSGHSPRISSMLDS